MDDSAGTSGTPEQPRKRQRCDTNTDYMQLMQQHVQLQQQQRQQQQQQQQQQQHQQQQQQQQPNAFCGPGPATNFGPVPATNFGPGPANNFGPGPANNFGPGLANNFQAFMHQALQAQQAQFNAFCQQMSLTGPVATMMQHMQQLARFPMPGPPPPPPPGARQWPQQQQHVNGMSQQPRQLKRSRRPKKGQAMVQKPGAPQGQKLGIPPGQKPMQPKGAQGQPQAQPQAQTSFRKKRCVATWTCYEPDGPPRSYVSDKKWSSQRKILVCDVEGQCPYPFQGRTISDFVLLGPQTVMPPQPQSRYCDDCGGLVLNELRHKESRKHREAMELDVALICARIRRDPAFAAAVISAARECIETTGVAEADSDNSDMSLVDEEDDDDYDDVDDDGGDIYKDDDEPLPGKKGSDKPSNQQPSGAVASSSTDEFGFLENEVFRRAPDGNKLKGGQDQ